MPDGLFNRLVARVVNDEGHDRELAERIVDQALVFLKACAVNDGLPLAPSRLVDLGWHTFILHTRDYADFCERIAGRFIHHVPTDDIPEERADHMIVALARTGLAIDDDLWSGAQAGSCTGCANGCHDDPPPNPPGKR
ncbi:glycine-rich domain-containing protein [Lentzea kentuckyensis]|uniref:glycine-rich domain-containing protein n=1 Tax=Lentzea kentuckyensis TaxID=360086 RepID=UPI001FE90EA2|nr:hypothetical protein [Lentzea kentuckyensis]